MTRANQAMSSSPPVTAFILILLLSAAHAAANSNSAITPSDPPDNEFSLDEFYSIKRSLLLRKGKRPENALGLRKAQEKALAARQPPSVGNRFYGQDHYEQSRTASGREYWTHVGRPDELAFHLFFRAPLMRNGTFVEVGAGDGAQASNTLFFEESLGWTGLLVEGSVHNFVPLLENGRRNQSVKIHSAVCERPGSKKFVGDGLAAGAVEDLSRHHMESWAHHFKNLDVYDVPCNPMRNLVRLAKLGDVIDLLSIDVEGAEYRALSTFDWDKHRVRVVIIEMGKSCFVGTERRCEKLLREKGFCRVAKRAVNEFWTSDEGFKRAYCSA